MATAYHTEAHERRYQNRTILIENATPVYRWEERETVKKAIEERLYDIFYKLRRLGSLVAPFFAKRSGAANTLIIREQLQQLKL